MITEKEMLLYEEYGGWLDGYLIKNSNHPNPEFESMDWNLISRLIGDIVLVINKKASSEFQEKLMKTLKENTENDIVIDHLERLAKKQLLNPL